MDDGQPISYMALPVGAAVLSSTNTQFGTVEHVLQIPELDIFDGIAIKTKDGLRFVDRDQVTDITTTLVRCALTDEEAASLPAPKGSLVLHPDTAHDEGPSLTARFGRLFGREHWKELEERLTERALPDIRTVRASLCIRRYGHGDVMATGSLT